MKILVYGASASGKSEFAESLAMNFKTDNLIYIATMKPFGNEARNRIARHHALRLNKGFETIEKYENIGETEIPLNSTVLLECMSNLTANEFYREDGSMADFSLTEEKIISGIDELSEKAENLVIVTNNVFESGLDYSPETIEYMKLLGKINIILAHKSDRVYDVISGIPKVLKG